MKNLAGLMKQAGDMQKKMEAMQATLEAAIVEGSAGAGMVVIRMTGKGDLRELRIDPKLLDPAEVEMLQDLLIAAHGDARRKVEEAAQAEMLKVTGGLPLPAGMKLPF